MSLNALKRRARVHGLVIRKVRYGGFLLVDPYIGALVAPGEMSLEQLELWLDDLDAHDE